MNSFDLEKNALEKAGNRYLLAVLLADRTRQLKLGAKPLVEVNNGDLPYVIALREIAEGKIDQTTRMFPKDLDKMDFKELDGRIAPE
jgi:DNA-directed RNA polymerase subunit omega